MDGRKRQALHATRKGTAGVGVPALGELFLPLRRLGFTSARDR
ncbi:MAG: hypothetical protein ACLQJR_15270 [Stellaceae bacterium]